MSFWRSDKNKTPSASIETPDLDKNAKSIDAPSIDKPKTGSENSNDRILSVIMDFAAGLLRDYGRTAIDIEKVAADTIRQWCENWAEHLLVGTPRPGDSAKQAPIEKRDWAGARKFFAERRREEAEFITRSLAALQQAVWALIKTLDGMLERDGEDSGKLHSELQRLRVVAEKGSPADILRKEVLSSVEEIGKLAQAHNQELRAKVDGLSAQIKSLGGQLEAARQESEIDSLTRLFNRKAFDERLAQAVAMSRLFGHNASLLLVEVDGFKSINDIYGRVAGDSTLREMADSLIRVFFLKSEFVARYGGEEFAVLLIDIQLKQALSSAERVLNGLRNVRIMHNDKSIRVSATIGVAELSRGETGDEWLARADQALTIARAQGGGKVIAAGRYQPSTVVLQLNSHD